MHSSADDGFAEFSRQRLVSVREAATALGVSVRLVWRLLATEQLAKVQVGRCVRIPQVSLDEFIAKGGAR